MVLLLEQPQQHFAYLVRIRPRSQTPGQEGNEAVASRRKSLNSATSHLQRSDRFSCGGLAVLGAFLCAAVTDLAAMMCEPGRREIEDTRRVKKLGDDVDRLRSASADDWWDVTKTRVNEYVDRVEASVKRLDDNKS